nr:MAG TPA: hypothetical protein [Bacteriophage sp.]
MLLFSHRKSYLRKRTKPVPNIGYGTVCRKIYLIVIVSMDSNTVS